MHKSIREVIYKIYRYQKILEEEKTTCFEKPIHMIQEEFKKRDEKIGKSNNNNFYKVYY